LKNKEDLLTELISQVGSQG